MDIYQEHLNLLLPSWLRKIGDAYHGQAARVYNTLDIPFETSWFPVFLVLNKHHQTTVSAIAEILDISQPAVSQVTAALQKRGLVKIRVDKKDARKKNITLSDSGAELMFRLQPVWTSMDRAMAQLLYNHMPTQDLAKVLETVDHQVSENLYDSVLSLLSERPFKIKALSQNRSTDVYDILKKREGVEFIYPETSSKVFVALAEEEVVGAVAVERQNDGDFILHNLYVCRDFRLKGIAKSLLKRAIPEEGKVCIIMDRATPQLVDLLLKCAYSFKVEVNMD